MIMCVLLCYPVSIHMSQVQATGRPISSLIIISILLDMDMTLPFPLNHPSLLLIYRYSFLRVSTKFGVEV